ncbi:MAG: GNAT family N-acetyltransferase [Desulfomonile tiedjei]|nr:GNAT family N-acetyltransferase [Desulfomonile tiedjei]
MQNAALIFRATDGDAEAILALQHLAYRSEAELYDDFEMLPLTQTIEDLKESYGTHVFLKAVADGRIAGSVRAEFQNGTCRIGRLIVHPDFQGNGIGTQLMERIEAFFGTAGRYELFTGHRSFRNLRLYQRLGYREFSRQAVSDKVTLVFMEKIGRNK